MNITSAITPGLRALRSAFVTRGFDVRIVGGAVRDLLTGIPPKDTDLCTDANPDEQIAIYRTLGLRYFETGLQHGTVTVLIEGDPVEITSLRTETDHDGRHAKVRYTRDWLEDLSRRDLTVNAMALTLDGDLIDPFGGRADLAERRVRFVGDPAERMREDYLRILRWLRFHARIAGMAPLDEDATTAALRVGNGLLHISRERVWSEVSRMLVNPEGLAAFTAAICPLGLARYIDLPTALHWNAARVAVEHVSDPVAILAVLLHHRHEVVKLAANWKWSGEERDRGLFLASRLHTPHLDARALVARDGARKDWTALLCRLRGDLGEADFIAEWDVPTFPVGGDDLIAAGMTPGPEMGQRLKALRERWTASGYTLGKGDLLA